jgi:hypothetical protein
MAFVWERAVGDDAGDGSSAIRDRPLQPFTTTKAERYGLGAVSFHFNAAAGPSGPMG